MGEMDSKKLAEIAEVEFPEIVEGTSHSANRLRIFLKDLIKKLV